MVYRLFVVAGENETLRDLLEQLGGEAEIRVLDSANDALWEIRSDPPEVIIADINLPDMSGLELAEILPSFDVPTQVLLYSREHDPAAEKQAEEYGVYSFVYEPIVIDELRTALEAAVQASKTAAAAPPPEPEPVPDLPEPEPEPTAEPEPEPEPEPMAEPATEPATDAEEEPRFTPARVRLPPISERSSAPTSPTPRSRRLADRTRSSMRERPAQAPAPEQPEPQRRASGTLVLTSDNLAPIQSIMGRLAQDLGTQCIMLTDRAGMVLVEVGSTHDLPTMILLPLLSTSFSTAGEVARQLREQEGTTVYIHEGISYDLYCFDIAQRFLLVLVFNKKVASSKIGTVWISTKRAIRDLHDELR